jgi:hypothetical protein
MSQMVATEIDRVVLVNWLVCDNLPSAMARKWPLRAWGQNAIAEIIVPLRSIAFRDGDRPAGASFFF